jgi:hypothetical protein
VSGIVRSLEFGGASRYLPQPLGSATGAWRKAGLSSARSSKSRTVRALTPFWHQRSAYTDRSIATPRDAIMYLDRARRRFQRRSFADSREPGQMFNVVVRQ